MERRPIQSFYCVYLLRSTVSSKSLYIGSTPHPRRRLAQHNGEAPGGANRTSRNKLRPWEMVCIVAGFPSSIAALQFEWAWQNPHISTKIPRDQRVFGSKRKTKRGRMKLVAPKTITAKLESLHLLLRVNAFSRWPLSVNFFTEDVYNIWTLWCQRESTTLRKGIKIVLDLRRDEGNISVGKGKRKNSDKNDNKPQPSSQVSMAKERGKRKWSPNGEGGVQGLDISNSDLERHLQRSRDILQSGSDPICNICHGHFLKGYSSAVVCPHAFCEHIAHITCLADEFLQQEKCTIPNYGGMLLRPVLPTDGKCPGCKKETYWVDLVKELSVRTRLKQKQKKKTKQKTKKDKTALRECEEGGDGDDSGEEDEDDEDDEDEDEEEGDITAVDLAEIPGELDGEQFEWGDHDTDTDSALSDFVGRIKDVKSRKTTKNKGEMQTKKEFLIMTGASDIESLSDVSSKIRSGDSARKENKRIPKVQGKRIPLLREDKDMDSALGSRGSDHVAQIESGSKAGKGRGRPRGKKILPVIGENKSSDSMLEKVVNMKDESKVKKSRGGAKIALPVTAEDSEMDSILSETASVDDEGRPKRIKRRPKKTLPVVIEDSDWDGVDIIV